MTNYCQTLHSHEGEDATLQVWASGYPRPMVTWFHEGKQVKSDHSADVNGSSTLMLACVEPRRAGLYHFIVSNNSGSVEGEMRLVVHAVDDEAALPMLDSKVVPIVKFGDYVAGLHENGNRGFTAQYEVKFGVSAILFQYYLSCICYLLVVSVNFVTYSQA